MTTVVVGCPVQDRAWILPHWFERIEGAAADANVTPHYVFVGNPTTDPTTFAAIDLECLTWSRDRDVVEIDEAPRTDARDWSSDRYAHMVTLRNELLGRVRKLAPDFFWSVDSDILVAGRALASALNVSTDFDAVGSRCYMTPTGSWCPSYAMLPALGGLTRPDNDGVLKVDVIMAAKLMRPLAYHVDYITHRQGEDIGWSIAARSAGCRLGWDGRQVSKHVMSPSDLEPVDVRCGF